LLSSAAPAVEINFLRGCSVAISMRVRRGLARYMRKNYVIGAGMMLRHWLPNFGSRSFQHLAEVSPGRKVHTNIADFMMYRHF
jgi:hypothetical protein